MAKSEKDDIAHKAIESSWDMWLAGKWEYSDRPDRAVQSAVETWLNKNSEALIAAIAKAVAERHQG